MKKRSSRRGQSKEKSLFLLLIVGIQLFLIMTLVPANSGIIGKIFSIEEIGNVEASDDDLAMYCCPLTNDGAICQDILSVNTDDCAVNIIETGCGYTSICATGCCIDPLYGDCDKSTKQECIEDEGDWKSEGCDISQCSVGCCVLGDEYKWRNRNECEFLSGDDDMDFRTSIETEQACLSLRQTQGEGACLFEGRCIFSTSAQCTQMEGDFSQDNICSNPALEEMYGYDYTPQDHVGCVEGEEDIYYFDSEDNKEGVASGGDCEENQETCALKEDGTGYECKDLSCRDPIKAKDFYDRYERYPEHGESWCIYDGYIGEISNSLSYTHWHWKDGRKEEPVKIRGLGMTEQFSAAAVGSEHWQASCFNGEINQGKPYRLCGDFRGSICSESKSEYEDDPNNFFVTGDCGINYASSCLSNNPLQKAKDDKMVDISQSVQNCNDNPQCMIKIVDLTKGNEDNSFKFKMCVPKYPKGDNLGDGVDGNICKIANQVCPVVYTKSSGGHWECKSNCECESEGFTKQMNDLCVSLGDCGSYINYVGDWSSNSYYTGKRGYEIDRNSGKEKDGNEGREAKPSGYSGCDIDNEGGGNPGENADCKNVNSDNYNLPVQEGDPVKVPINNILINLGLDRLEIPGPEYGNFVDGPISKWLGTIPGVIGTLPIIAKTSWFVTAGTTAGGVTTYAGTGMGIGGVTIGAVGFAVGAAAIGMGLGFALTKLFGVNGIFATITIASGGAAGLTFALIKLGIGLPPLIGWGLIVVAILSSLFGGITGAGDTETRYVEFQCNPWTPPTTGYDCEACNADPMKKCTQYRCESLGTMCEFLDDGSSSPPCIKTTPEVNPPIITRTDEITGCITQGNTANIQFSTDEFAQCKWSTERPTEPGYDAMDGKLFEENTQWSKTHTLVYVAPRVDGLDPRDVTGSIPNRVGHVKIYVKCQDYQDPPNPTFDEYATEICINEQDSDPVIYTDIKMTPENRGKLPFGTTSTFVKMEIPEPGECRYDRTAETAFENMNNSFECKGLGSRDFFGYPCTANLTGLNVNENKFYIRCKDLAENINNEDYEYSLRVSEKELKVEAVSFVYDDGIRGQTISPGEKFKTSEEFISVEMKVSTSEGIDGGKSSCYWGIQSGENVDLMEPYYVFSETHTKTLYPRFAGTYPNYIECVDEAGNIATSEATFEVEVDSSAPTVVRAFYEAGKLKIFTNEEAKCYYNDYNKCNPFNFDNATSMTTAFSKEHSTTWDSSRTYYIKCQDLWGNANDGCAIKIKSV